MRKMYLNGLKYYGDGTTHNEEIMENLMTEFLKEISDTKESDFDISRCIRKSFGSATSALVTGNFPHENDWNLIYEFIYSVNLLETPGYVFIYRFIPFIRFLPGKLGQIFKTAEKATNDLIERFYCSIKDSFDKNKNIFTGLGSVLLKLQHEENMKQGDEYITDKNVKGMMLDTLFAATETAATALINGFALFVEHSDTAKKIQAEVNKVIGNGRLPKSSDKNVMPYSMATVWEILRYTSVIPLSLPHKLSKSYNFKGYFIEKNAVLFPNVWYIHHDPNIWKEPWTFRPERFLDTDGQLLPLIHRLMLNVLPFSTGQRKCPGDTIGISRMFLYITSVLQSFDIVPAESGHLPDNDPRHYKQGAVILVKDYMGRAIPRRELTDP